ncbi:hypothetical protein O6H91_15G078600 [Diphasiastrum complanatum]|nr:hypothetical protein O6H91_15G078600 [Diphasiastrum complanatum]
MDAMASSQLSQPLSDHLSHLLIAHSELQMGSSQFAKDHLFWQLSVLQKQLNSAMKTALAADDVVYSMPSPSMHDETTCSKALPISSQDLELPYYDVAEDEWDGDSCRGMTPTGIAALQSFLNSTAEDASAAEDLYSCDEFRMFEFKVRRCTRGRSHDWTECPFAHPGEKARRRDPRRFHYSGTACADFRKGSCKRGDACEFAHGVFECWLHPARYRTQPCKDGINCPRRVCFFAHTPQQLRLLPASSTGALKSPGSSRSHPTSEKKHQFGSFHCNLDEHCTVCAAASFQTPSPTSTLISLPESPPSLSPPLSPTSPCHLFQLSVDHRPLATSQKLARHLSIPSRDQTPSINSFISAPSSPSTSPFLSSPTVGSAKAKAIAMADLAAGVQQLEYMQDTAQSWLHAQSHCSSLPSPLRHTTQSLPCSPFIAAGNPFRVWEANVDQNAVVNVKSGGGIRSNIYGDKEFAGKSVMEAAGDLPSRTCRKKMVSFECADGFPDLEWVDELVG